MSRDLFPEDLDPHHQDVDWQSLADRLERGAAASIQESSLSRRFLLSRESVEYAFDWNPRFVNASVEKRGDVYRVRFGLGLLGALVGLSRWMLDDGGVAPEFALRRVYPNDQIWDFFVVEWADWIIWHEFSHALCGHLCVVEGSAINDFEQPCQSSVLKNMRLRQAMELDADVAALNFYWIERMTRITEGRCLHLYGDDGEGAYLRDLGAAFGMLFSLWDKLCCGDEKLSSHPALSTRFMNWAVFSGSVFQRYNLVDPSMALSSLLSGFASIFGSLSLVDGTLHRKISEAGDLVEYRDELLRIPLLRKRPRFLPVDFLNRESK